MAKQMLSTRVDTDLRDELAREALTAGRSVSNMLERILRERYAVLAEREKTKAVVQVDSRSVTPSESVPSRSVSVAAVPPLVQNQPMEKMARDLAVVGGKCAADVAWGTKCKLCGKVHG